MFDKRLGKCNKSHKRKKKSLFIKNQGKFCNNLDVNSVQGQKGESAGILGNNMGPRKEILQKLSMNRR